MNDDLGLFILIAQQFNNLKGALDVMKSISFCLSLYDSVTLKMLFYTLYICHIMTDS